MKLKQKIFLYLTLCSLYAFGQNNGAVAIQIMGSQKQPLTGASIELVKQKDSSLVKSLLSDSLGKALFSSISPGSYFCRISRIGYAPSATNIFILDTNVVFNLGTIILQPKEETLSAVTVTGRKAFIEWHADKMVVNLDAGITNTGTTAAEALEKMPGITIDKDGNISLKGRSGVTVMIDGKQTYLSSSDLATLLNGMSSTQISQVEIMDNPSARYDAAGNAGLINIITKRNRQKGFNGSVSTAYSQGFYPKSNNSLQLNYRNGKWNVFSNYSVNLARNFTRLYALRTYLQQDEKTIRSLLEQPSFIKGKGITHTLRAGLDYAVTDNTIVGLNLSGLALSRESSGNSSAQWMNNDFIIDSLIQTSSRNKTSWQNAGANLNLRHSFTASRGLSADVDFIQYNISGNQFFENISVLPSTYSEASKADIPSGIRIYSAKADYSQKIKNWKFEGGWKTSLIKTDNEVAYEFRVGTDWKPDLGKTNHFLYKENIHALYSSAETKKNAWTVQGGLRYEWTSYDAKQLGNAVVKDSSFSRSYNSLFPTLFASFTADSAHSFSLSAGRRIDRPPFQKLNPFLFIINKYTYQKGNPFYRPQYTWNIELTHTYKEAVTTSLSYSTTNDYFSQIFPLDSNGIVHYTEGNLGRLQNWGLSLGVQKAPASWWSVSAQAVLNYKRLEGFIEKAYKTNITQVSFNLTNSFKFNKDWAGELSGFYMSRSQHDIQEVVDPSGSLSIGIAKTVLKSKGTLKLSVRDLFYTQWMKGLTQFVGATEYFKLTRDTRVVGLSFSWRFGNAFKATKRSGGAAGEEIERVGNG